MGRDLFRVAALGELRLTTNDSAATSWLRPALSQAAANADVIALCGNLTDSGEPNELAALLECLTELSVPVLVVLGRRDYHAGREDELADLLEESGAHVLDGSTAEIDGVGFAGTKGAPGGYGASAIDAVGEPELKAFIRETDREVEKLEIALQALNTPVKVVLMHYAPTDGTLAGEPVGSWPWLGSAKFWAPIRDAGVAAVFHANAPQGTSLVLKNDIAVFNVSRPVLTAQGVTTRLWSKRVPDAIAPDARWSPS